MNDFVYQIADYVLYATIIISWIAFLIHWKSNQRTLKILRVNLLLTSISAALLWIAYGVMLLAFLNHDYKLLVVYNYSDNSLGITDLIMATWASRQGVMLLWAAITATIALFSVFYLRQSYSNIVTGRTLTILLFFSALIASFSLSSRPFEIGFAANDGLGLPPSLLSYWQQIHPPVAFLAYSAFLFPYSSGLSMLSLNKNKIRVNEKIYWMNDLFMILGWGLTSIFMVAGSIWGYEENWAGFWAWDPVEIATLILWLVSSLYFHGKSHVSREHPLQHILLALGWVSVTFASFIVRGGMLDGFHNYAGLAKAIVFTLLFLGTSVGLIYSIRQVKIPLIPEKLTNLRLHPNHTNFYTFWIIVFASIINIVGLIFQIFRVLLFDQTSIPYFYYITLNGILLLSLVGLLWISEIQTKLISKSSKFSLLIISSVVSAGTVTFVAHLSFVGYLFITIMGIISISLIMITLMKLIKIKSGKKISRSLVHLTIVLMIFSYSAVDSNSHYVDEVLIPGKISIIEEFDLSIVGWREGGNEYPKIVLNITESDIYLGKVVLDQGVYLGDIWNNGDWIAKQTMDYYFILEEMERIELKRDAPIVLQIHHKPLTNMFRLTFYMFVAITFIAVIVRIRNQPRTKEEIL